jgi:hypothetical protein
LPSTIIPDRARRERARILYADRPKPDPTDIQGAIGACYTIRMRRNAAVVVLLALVACTSSGDGTSGPGPVVTRPEPTGAAASVPHGAPLQVTPAGMACAKARGIDVSAAVGARTRITNAALDRAGSYPKCVVRGVVAPRIHFEAWLPTETWRQRYLQTGCSGLCGDLAVIPLAAQGCAALDDGTFAVSAHDEGHGGGAVDGRFGRDPQARIDYAHRADHVVAVAVKTLIREFYGRPPVYSYFSGCSEGGRQALRAAQRYPGDFDGILAGAPAAMISFLAGMLEPWLVAANVDARGELILRSEKLPALHRAVLQRCDGLDGTVDGVIDEPVRCDFDPASIRCSGAEAPDCLTAAEVAAARRLYEGPVTDDGRRLYPGGEPYGSELAWERWMIRPTGSPTGNPAAQIASAFLSYLAFEQNPSEPVDVRDAEFDRATFDRLRRLSDFYDATDPDLSSFARRGGKLILWHGWADEAIPPTGTVAYYDALAEHAGGLAAARGFARLFMIPGMYHCVGGDGPSTFDALTPLLDWVERGRAPASLTVTGDVGGRAVSRSIPPYPRPDSPEPLRWLGSFDAGRQLWGRVDGGELVLSRDRRAAGG